MTLYQLECFLHLSHTLNFTQTAKELFITQSALSKSISSLEKELGVTLFTRNHHKVLLTSSGLSFADSCGKILADYQSAVEKLHAPALSGKRNFGIGLPSDSFEKPAVQFIHYMSHKYDDVHFDIKLYSSKQLFYALQQNYVDLIITSQTPPSDDYTAFCIQKRKECAVLSSIHPLAHQRYLTMKDLKDEPFVVLSPNVSATGKEHVFHYAALAGFTPNVVSEASSISSLLTLVACNVGVSTLYHTHQTVGNDYVRFIPLSDCPPHNRYVMWKTEQRDTLKLLLDELHLFFAPSDSEAAPVDRIND